MLPKKIHRCLIDMKQNDDERRAFGPERGSANTFSDQIGALVKIFCHSKPLIQCMGIGKWILQDVPKTEWFIWSMISLS
jgi:hypothetical protein